MIMPMGLHWLFDYSGCDQAVLDDEAKIRTACLEAAERAGATIVGQVFHRFLPQGVTGVVVLAESHLAVHTWPEYGTVAVDLFSCGTRMRAQEAAAFLRDVFRADRMTERVVPRGQDA